MRRRPAPSHRPVSAIFLGRRDTTVDPEETQRSRTSLLPSPPHTSSNSSGAGSTAESGTVGRKTVLSPLFTRSQDIMETPSSSKGKRPPSRSSFHDMQDENAHHDDEYELDDQFSLDQRPDEYYNDDHTARLSDDRRSGEAKSSSARSTISANSSGTSASRAKTLADRNRAVLQRLAAITGSSSRASARSPVNLNIAHRVPPAGERSPYTPSTPTFSAPSRASSDSSSKRALRVSLPARTHSSSSRPRASLHNSLAATPASGSETEREPRSSEEYSVTPAYTHQGDPSLFSKQSESNSSRRRPFSPSPPPTVTNPPGTERLLSDSTASFSSISRASNLPDPSLPSETPYSTSKYKSRARRAPLPQEFRDNSLSSPEAVSCS